MKPVLAGLLAVFLSLSGVHSQARKLDKDDPLRGYYKMLSGLWGTLYARGGTTLYCGRKFGHSKGGSINAEHIFPMSWATRALKCGRRRQCRSNNARFRTIENDMHNVWPALKNINQARQNYRPAIIQGENHSFGSCDFEVDEKRRIVEPRPVVRGEIARSMFYMQDRYGLYLQPRLVKLLGKWNRQDPPDDEERRRNAVIERLQGERNRFIDQHELIDRLIRQ